MGKYIFIFVVCALVAVIGFMLYPIVHTIWSAQDTSALTSIEKSGMVIGSYAFMGCIGYLVYRHVKG